jgi:hypothetical protein
VKKIFGDRWDVKQPKTDLFGPTNIIYTFDDIPDDKWFGEIHGRAKCNPANIAKYLQRRGYIVQHDEWYSRIHVVHKYNNVDGLLDDWLVSSHIKEQLSTYFQCSIKASDLKDGIEFLAKRNIINSRLQYLDSFLEHYDPTFDWVSCAINILACEKGDYEREIVRAMFAGVIQRSYYPGCTLQRVISLLGGQGIFKSDFTIMLAGNPTPKERKWWISKNLLEE